MLNIAVCRYFQAAQRDHEQKIQVCALGGGEGSIRGETVCKRCVTVVTVAQELHATHAADLRLLQEAKERERVLWEKEIDAALAHVKVGLYHFA